MTITTKIMSEEIIVLAKIETTYGDDPTPTVEENAIKAMNVKINVPHDIIENKIAYPDGNPHDPRTGKLRMELSFDTYFKNGGTAGTACRISPLLQSCGLTELADAGVDVRYFSHLSDKSCTIYVYKKNITASGNWQLYNFKGCVGNVEIVGQAGQSWILRFSFKSLYTKPSDASAPDAPEYESTEPLECKSQSISFNSITDLVIDTITINAGNEVAEDPDLTQDGGIKRYFIKNRKPTLTLNPCAFLVADLDIWAALSAASTYAFIQQQESVAGNHIRISGNAAITGVTPSERDGREVFDINCIFKRITGNDEYGIKLY